jgi:RHS repeat-associated protein
MQTHKGTSGILFKACLLIVIPVLFAGFSFAQTPYPGNDSDYGVTVPWFPFPYTGNMAFSTKDITVAGAGAELGLSWQRYGSSRTSKLENLFGLGHNWAHNWQWEMVSVGKDINRREIISVRYPNGMIYRFIQTSPGEWLSTSSARHRIVSKGDIFTLLPRGGAEVKFRRRQSGRGNIFTLETLSDTKGNIYKLTYSGNSLVKVSEPAGRWLKIEYKTLPIPNASKTTPPFKVISRVTSSDEQVVTYSYEFPENADYPVLLEVKYPDEYTASYTYAKQREGTRMLLAKADDPRGDSNFRGRYFRYRTEPDAAFGQILDIRAVEGDAVMQAFAADEVDTRGYAIKQANGATVYHYYYPGGNLSEKIDALGFSSEYEYSHDGRGLMTAAIDPLGNTTRYEYNTTGDRVKIIYPDNSERSWEYDDRGRILKETDELGNSRLFIRDSKGRIVRTQNPDGTIVERGYNNRGQLVSLKDANGGEYKYVLNIRGLRAKTIDPLGNVYTLTYNDNDLIESVIDPLGNISLVLERDAGGRVIRRIFPDGSSTSAEYDRFGQKIRAIDETGYEKKYKYDSFGRITSHFDAGGNETRYEYAPICETGGCPARTVSPSGRVTSKNYNERGEIASITKEAEDTNPSTTIFGYDPNGRRTIITDSLGRSVKYFYDKRDRLIKTMSSRSFVTTYKYDAKGNKISRTDSKGNTTSWTYDEAGRKITETNANGHVTKWTYYPSGRLATLTDPNGNTYIYEYDALGRQTALVFPDGARETTTYDATGKILAFRNRSGVVRSFHRDERGREISSQWNDGSQDIVKTYDPAGRILSADNGISRISYVYDKNGRVISETQDISPIAAGNAFDPEIRTIQYTYTDDGNRESIIYPDGSRIFYTYDEIGRLENILGEGDARAIASYEYDAVGNAIRIPRENNTQTLRSFDPDNLMTQIVENDAYNNPLNQLDYTYDEEGYRTSTTETRSEKSVRDNYEYDSTYQVIGADYRASVIDENSAVSESSVAYSYDGVGNRRQLDMDGKITNYITNNLNQYEQIGEDFLNYDENGNLESMDGTSYHYDALNRLVKVSNSNMKAEFFYDSKNRVISRNFNGKTTLNTYANWNLIEERDNSDQQQARYIHGARIDEIIAFVNRNGVFYPHYDVLGNVTMLTDEQGNVVERYSYSVEGKVTIQGAEGEIYQNSSVENRWMFTGREWLKEIGLYDFRNRVYSPSLGRFLQPDPMNFNAGDINIYRYVLNNFVNFTDPNGLECRVYSAHAFGIPGMNHTFLWCTEANLDIPGIGTSTSFGWDPGDYNGTRPNFDPETTSYPSNPVGDLNGMTETQFVTAVSNHSGMNAGLYVPYINDCHSQLENAFYDLGVNYPGAPNGRMDLDDIFVDSLNSAVSWLWDKFTNVWSWIISWFYE